MAILNVVDFDTGDFSEVFAGYGDAPPVIQSDVVYSGNYAVRLNAGTGTSIGETSFVQVYKLNSTSGQRLYATAKKAFFRFYFRYAVKAPDGEVAGKFFTATSLNSPPPHGVVAYQLNLRSDGKIEICPNGLSQVVGNTVLAANTWYKIEFYGEVDSSNAKWKLLVNNALEAKGTADLSEVTYLSLFTIGRSGVEANYPIDYYYDNLMWRDDYWCGPHRTSELLLPNENGLWTRWTASSGEKWDAVNDFPYGEDLITETIGGYTYSAKLTDSSLTLNDALEECIAKNVVVFRTLDYGHSYDPDAINQFKSVFVSTTSHYSGTFTVGVDDNSGDYTALVCLFPTNPNNSRAWKVSALNSLEVGCHAVDVNGPIGNIGCNAMGIVVNLSCPSPYGAVADGSATIGIDISIVPAGVRGGGSATIGIAPSISGGAICAGSAIIGIAPSITGGAICNGEADVGVEVAVHGGILANGTTTIQATYSITSLGGAVVNGTANYGFFTVIVPTGGAVCSGSAVSGYDQTPNPAYGVKAGGTALVSALYYESRLIQTILTIPSPKYFNKYRGIPNKTSRQYDGLTSWYPTIAASSKILHDPIHGRELAAQNLSADIWWSASADRRGTVVEFIPDGGQPENYFRTTDSYTEHNLGLNGTISVWLRIPSVSESGTGGMITKQNSGTPDRYSLILGSSGLLIGFQIVFNNSNITTINTTNPADNLWHLYTLTRNDNVLKLFFDGQLASSLFVGFSPVNPAGILYLGTGDAKRWAMDDLRFYNRSLTDTEVSNLFNAQTRWELYEDPAINTLAVTTVGYGVVCGGTASLGADGILVSAGVRCGGTAIVENGNIYYPQGGVVCGGTGTTNVIYSPISTGGVKCGGTPEYGFVFYPPITGGAVCGGAASVTFFDYENGTGGVVCNGTSSVVCEYSVTTIGGAVVNGHGLDFRSYTEPTTGGIVCSGDSTDKVRYNPSISGSALINSSAPTTFFDSENGTGGALAGATASTTFFDYVDGTGGAVCGGIAETASKYDIVAEGGAVCNGIALFTYDITSSGGAVCGGLATTQFFGNIQVDGGAICGNDAFVFVTYNQISTGGVIVNGSSQVFAIFTVTPTGVALVNSSALVVYWITPYLPTGSALCNSTSLVAATYKVIATSNGVVLGTHFGYNQEENMSGGVICTGDSFGYMYTEEGHGGVLITGLAQRSFDHIYRKVDCEAEVKCGYEKKDQFCATIQKMQSFSSKFKTNRPDLTAICLSQEVCYGTSAFVPAITFCQQELRLYPEDLAQPVTLQPDEDEDLPLLPVKLTMLATTVADSSQFKSITEMPPLPKALKNTPKMIEFKKNLKRPTRGSAVNQEASSQPIVKNKKMTFTKKIRKLPSDQMSQAL